MPRILFLMALKKRIRNFYYILKDKASVLTAWLTLPRHVSMVRLSILRATTHSLSTPSLDLEARILAVITIADLLPPAGINALQDRLHRTHSATVALKCLLTLHNVIFRGPLTLRDNLSCYHSCYGHNMFNLSSFSDDSDLESLQLSSWVRWYAGVLKHSISVSISTSTSTSSVLGKIDVFVGFVEQISRVPPESLLLQRYDLVYETVRLVGKCYFIVQYEISSRVEELRDRVEDLEVSEMAELVRACTRLEYSKKGLVLLFVNRHKNDDFWELIEHTKTNAAAKMEEREAGGRQ